MLELLSRLYMVDQAKHTLRSRHANIAELVCAIDTSQKSFFFREHLEACQRRSMRGMRLILRCLTTDGSHQDFSDAAPRSRPAAALGGMLEVCFKKSALGRSTDWLLCYEHFAFNLEQLCRFARGVAETHLRKVFVLYQLAQALQFMHAGQTSPALSSSNFVKKMKCWSEAGIPHGNLKPKHVLLSAALWVRVSSAHPTVDADLVGKANSFEPLLDDWLNGRAPAIFF